MASGRSSWARGRRSWFDKLTMSGEAQALQTARPELVLSAAEGPVEGRVAPCDLHDSSHALRHYTIANRPPEAV